MALTHREQLILLNLIPDVGSTHWRRLLEAFGDVERVCAAGPQALQQVEGITPQLAQRIAAGGQNDAGLRRELALAQREGATIVTRDDAAYPKPLRTIPDPPLALYVRGTLASTDEVAVAVVGARHASVYGIQCAERLAYDLALRGVSVVSGLARGIDGAAHRGALKTSGRTIAVLGGGLSRIYPPEHQGLADQIVRQGALISEYPMETAPLPHHFPRRNRLISGLSLGVVVVEASQRSGALITADCALEQGREVFAVPGPMTAVTSQGTHQLVKQGARLVTSVEDILEELRLIPLSAGPPAAPPVAGSAEGVTGGVAMQPLADPAADEAQAEPLDSPLARSGRIPPAPAFVRGGPGSAVESIRLRSGLDPEGTRRVEGEPIRLPPPERRVFACVDAHEPRYIDAIVDDSGLSLPEVSSALLHLELKQVIRQLPGKQFIRR